MQNRIFIALVRETKMCYNNIFFVIKIRPSRTKVNIITVYLIKN